MTHSFPTRRSSDRQGQLFERVVVEAGAGLAGQLVLALRRPAMVPADVVGQRCHAPLEDHVREEKLLAVLARRGDVGRSEEHTSELQSLMRISYAVFCLKKKKKQTTT